MKELKLKDIKHAFTIDYYEERKIYVLHIFADNCVDELDYFVFENFDTLTSFLKLNFVLNTGL